MNAIVVGLGSMGRRRARLLKECAPSFTIVGIDTQEARRKQAAKELGIQTEDSIQSACEGKVVDMAFISTSPLAHAGIIKECLERNLHVFSELNLTDRGYDENIRLAKDRDRVLFLSSTFLYREEVGYIKEAVNRSGCPLTYIYHAGQYLPDWHPWESYKDFFVGSRATNGCREFMAIEFPWLIDVFGNIKVCHSISSRNSTLEIDFPDTYQIMFEHETGHKGLISIDIVSRKAVRNFELSGEDIYITWDGTPDGLARYDYVNQKTIGVSIYENVERMNGYSSFVIENAYKKEILNFIDVIKGKNKPMYSFEKDKYVISLINKIEKSETRKFGQEVKE